MRLMGFMGLIKRGFRINHLYNSLCTNFTFLKNLIYRETFFNIIFQVRPMIKV